MVSFIFTEAIYSQIEMTLKNKLAAQRIYILLGALFITSLVVSNLIFQKFFYWYWYFTLPYHLFNYRFNK